MATNRTDPAAVRVGGIRYRLRYPRPNPDEANIVPRPFEMEHDGQLDQAGHRPGLERAQQRVRIHRERDASALARIHDHLLPGGAVLLSDEVATEADHARMADPARTDPAARQIRSSSAKTGSSRR